MVAAPVIPAIWEAEAGESLEPKRWRLQWAEITPLHSSLGKKSETLSQKKKKQKQKNLNHHPKGKLSIQAWLHSTGFELEKPEHKSQHYQLQADAIG